MESLFRHTGITINFYDRQPQYLVDGYMVNSFVNSNITHRCENYTSYNHEIGAMGGYLTANIEIPMSVTDAETWYEKGLGRKVKVLNHAGNCIWEGFVNEISVRLGADSLSIGPLVGIGNIIGAMYTPINYDYYPPIVGSEMETTLVEDIYSQGLYGKWEKWLSVGQAETAAAEQVRDVFLSDMAYPDSSDSLGIYSGESPVVTLACVGNLYWLTAYVYNNLSEGVDTLSTKLLLILDAEPNGVISADYSNIEENLYLVGIAEDRNRYAWDIIKELLSIGNDTDFSRRLFGVYNDGVVKYSRMPDVVEYIHYLGDRSRKITTMDNSIVPPWEIVPGKWIEIPDFMSSSSFTSPAPLYYIHYNVKNDLRCKFIESVRYTSPYSLDLSGGRNDKLSQMLAKIAYSGGML